MLTLNNLKLLFWNTQQKLPRWLFLLRMFIVLVGILGPLFYTIPLEDFPTLLFKANNKISEDSQNNFQIKILTILIYIIVLIVI